MNHYKPMLQWMNHNQCYWDEWASTNAIVDQHEKTLHWFKNHPVPQNMNTVYKAQYWLGLNGRPWNHWSCNKVAQEGDLEGLKWLCQNHCYPDEETFATASAYGQIEIMNWLHPYCHMNETAIHNAIIFNQQDSFSWLLEHQAPMNEEACLLAVKHNRLDMLKQLINHGCPIDFNCCLSVTMNQNILNWLQNNK